jgi:hypothetical protein
LSHLRALDRLTILAPFMNDLYFTLKFITIKKYHRKCHNVNVDYEYKLYFVLEISSMRQEHFLQSILNWLIIMVNRFKWK